MRSLSPYFTLKTIYNLTTFNTTMSKCLFTRHDPSSQATDRAFAHTKNIVFIIVVIANINTIFQPANHIAALLA